MKISRYLFGFVLIIFAFVNPWLWYVILLSIILYSYWAYRKVYSEFNNIKVGLWGIVMQYTTDLSVILALLTMYIYKND